MPEKENSQAMTPMVRQYNEIKKNYKDTILFFRLGDFYEMFYDDAVIASRELELTLTARNTGDLAKIPMAGIPFHAADNYINRLIKKGHKVAICEQVEDPKLAKKLVKRDVIQIITPGTVTDFAMLNQKSNNYLMSISMDKERIALSLADLSTGEFLCTENRDEPYLKFLENEITRLNPVEVIIPEKVFNEDKKLRDLFSLYNGILVNKYYDWCFEPGYARNQVLELFNVKSLDGFGIDNKTLVISAAGALVHYLNETQKQSVRHLDRVKLYSSGDFMELDNATVRNLELIRNQFDGSSEHTLFSVLDRTRTPMAARLMRKFILEPLTDKERIKARLDHVEYFFNDNSLRHSLRGQLARINDIERLGSRIALKKANPRDLAGLKNSLKISNEIKDRYKGTGELASLISRLPDTADMTGLIEKCLVDEPPLQIGKEQVIRTGFDPELDKYRSAEKEGKDWILSLQQEEIKKTGINSLKIKYNQVFGYYIEISKPNLHLVPASYIRKQTLVNAERFTFPRLQEYEELILSSSEKVLELEHRIYNGLLDKLILDLNKIKAAAGAIAELDLYSSLAETAVTYNYCRPVVNSEDRIMIKNSRHPVIERSVKEEAFIPNDILLDNTENRILIITGPNMAGKSTYLRQAALITLMAQTGSFVPAEKAECGIVDKIFTRIGASDNITKGQSTFLVEMNETANILNNATAKSLIIMDEIGRGTSTYDGLSIAWSIIEYIYDQSNVGAKTLFATHYHELTQLGRKKGIRNYNILVREWNDTIIFLRKVVEGSADRSYGIQVAQLAGIPKEVITRAKEILLDLEADNVKDLIISQSDLKDGTDPQLNLFQVSVINPVESEIIQALKSVDLNTLTPIEALNILNSIKDKLNLLNRKTGRPVNDQGQEQK
ncbi:MAG: DNA mismatch repair protein MutS [bacterium]|nr:DNA mismatch repair protein MutS [bacterium]